MKVLYIAGEALPFASSGGLGDVIGSLPAALKKGGDDVRVIMPLYGSIPDEYRRQMQYHFYTFIRLSWRNLYCGVFSLEYKGVTFYFLDNEYYFKRGRIYGEFDDGERFAFFCRAALEILPRIDFFPDILHAHDWHAALSVIYLKRCYSLIDERYSRIKAIFTIHNIQYQGIFGFEILGEVFGLMNFDREIVEFGNCINLLKGAIVCADAVTTVSPTYAKEILTPEFSHGLHPILVTFGFKLYGILNGIDTEYNDPKTDKALYANYSVRDMSGKKVCRDGLCRETGLPEDDRPVVAIVSRLVSHKGLDLVRFAGDEIMRNDIKLVVLGMGDSLYEDYFRYMESRYPDRCRAMITYDRALSKRVYSGADIFLMPSKSEPCGLAQMICSRYGAIPVIHETGGLYDSIRDVGCEGGGNGFTFGGYYAGELADAVNRAVGMYYHDREGFENLRKKVMRVDFSWKKSAKEYKELYEKIDKIF